MPARRPEKGPAMSTILMKRIAAFTMVTVVLAACGGGDDPPPPAGPPPGSGNVIGPAGGTVTGPGGAQVMIPAGALAANATISIEQSSAGAPALVGTFGAFGQTFAFTPHGIAFAAPATVTLAFDPAQVPAGRTPAMYKTNGQGQWERVANATVGASTVSAPVTSFSWIILGNLPPTITQQPQDRAVAEGAPATFTVAAFGTPPLVFQWRVSSDGGVTFTDLAGENANSLTIAATSIAQHHGRRYRLVIDSPEGATTSNAATLTVSSQPPPVSGARIAAGGGFTVARLASGQLQSWGTDLVGQLGDDPGDNSRRVPGPVDIVPDAVHLTIGTAHSIAVRANGQVYGWGYNGFGQLGLGDNNTRTSPVPMSNGAADAAAAPTAPLQNAASACSGTLHAVLRLNTGQLVATGRNEHGQLGDGSNTDRLRPVRVDDGSGSFSAEAIACGFDHALALRNGRVYAWGGNADGQLGDGTLAARNRPALLAAPTNVVAIAAGDRYSLAIDSNGKLWAWGSNINGKLGDGTEIGRTMPVQVTGLSNVTAVAASNDFTLALAGGVVHAWGINEVGTLGNGSLMPGFRSTPGQVTGLPAGITAIAASRGGIGHAFAIDGAGNVWGWGYNADGQLGIGSDTAIFSTPQRINGLNLN